MALFASIAPSFVRTRGLLVAALLLMLGTLVRAQGMQLPDPPGAGPSRAGSQAASAELAVTPWTRNDLETWWSALRAMDGSRENLPPQLQPPTDPAAWHRVDLPDKKIRETGKNFGSDPLYQMRWYRLRYAPADGQWPTSVAIYVPRLTTLAAAVLVKTESGWRPVFDNQAGAREQWVRPLWAVFPAALTGGTDKTAGRRLEPIDVVLAVPVLRDGFYAVSTVSLGPREDLEPLYRRRWALQIGVPQATGLTLVVLGLFSMALWVRRRDEPAYLLFALSSVAWLIRNLHYHVDMPRSPLQLDWFWWVTHASLSWVMLLTILFALRFARQRHVLFERLLAVFVGLGSVLTMPQWDALSAPEMTIDQATVQIDARHRRRGHQAIPQSRSHSFPDLPIAMIFGIKKGAVGRQRSL